MSRVLVLRGGAIGDFILTLPAIRLLRDGLPERPRLEILGYESIARLAVEAGLADAVRSIEHASLAPFFAPGSKLDPDLADYFASFDLVVSYLYDPDGFLASNLERAGVRTLLQGSHRMDEDSGIPAARQLATPLEQIALFLETPYVTFPKERASEAGPPTIAIHPGSGSPLKNWGYENWTATAAELYSKCPQAEFLLLSGEAEADTIADCLHLFEEAQLPFRHFQGEPLDQLARHLQSASLFLGHDSGVSHLAAACDIPCLLLFGPTDPVTWAPQNPGVHVRRSPDHALDSIVPSSVAGDAAALLKL